MLYDIVLCYLGRRLGEMIPWSDPSLCGLANFRRLKSPTSSFLHPVMDLLMKQMSSNQPCIYPLSS